MRERLRNICIPIAVAQVASSFGTTVAQLPQELVVNQHLVRANRLLAGNDFGAALDEMDTTRTARSINAGMSADHLVKNWVSGHGNMESASKRRENPKLAHENIKGRLIGLALSEFANRDFSMNGASDG